MPSQGHAKRRPTSQTTDIPTKRTRVSRACDQCRVAREKCDGVQPMCSTCSTSNRACTYTANPKKRGIQPGYIRALELALACLFQHNAENEQLLNDKLAQGGSSCLLLSRDSKESNRLHKKWRKGLFYRDIDKLLSGGETSRHEPRELLSPQSDDEESDMEEPLVTPIVQNEESEQGKQDEIRLYRPLHQQPSTSLPQTSTLVSLPLDCWLLLETYFIYTQSWFPISEKHDLLKLSYSYPSQGIPASPDLPESGSHAELWSILATASIYKASNMNHSNQQDQFPKTTPKQLYDTAKSWIPNEIGSFDLGHVKALLNLAIFNISQSLVEPAWLLVGCASRIIETMNGASSKASPRRKHTLVGCFILDSFLALRLCRRPYFRYSDIQQLGNIDEESLEEWQPWTSGLHSSSLQQTRTPVLSISSFNSLLDVVDILARCEELLSLGTSTDHVSQCFKIWRASLPAKLDYIRSDDSVTPLTPPAVLLQLTSYTVALSLAPSQPQFHQILQLLERVREHMGLASLPPVASYLLEIIIKHCARLAPNQVSHTRVEKLQHEIAQAWRIPSQTIQVAQVRTNETPTIPPRQPTTALQMPTPESVQHPLSLPQATRQPAVAGRTSALPIVNNSTRSDLHTSPSLYQPDDNFLDLHSPALPDPHYPHTTNDLESFFDDLASLDNSNRLEHQPQFMQNLGFAPDANMADLFGEYIPLQSSAFVAQENIASMPFDQYNFFDES